MDAYARRTQASWHLVKQMKSFRDGVRTSDDGVMAATMKGLTAEQIEAIAQYLCSL